MITYANSGNDAIWELYGKKRDREAGKLPTHDRVPNASQYIEWDTGLVFFFDAEDKTWNEFGGG